MIQCQPADVYKSDGWWKRTREVEMQTPVVERDAEQEVEVPQCRHHWVIDSPQGATSLGRCKLCNEVKEFRNSAADTLWEGDPMRSISKMGARNRPVIAEVSPGMKEE